MTAAPVSFGYTLSSEEHSPSDLVANARRAEEVGFEFRPYYRVELAGAVSPPSNGIESEWLSPKPDAERCLTKVLMKLVVPAAQARATFVIRLRLERGRCWVVGSAGRFSALRSGRRSGGPDR